MPRSDRAPSFQFYPGDHLLDDAVAAMSYDEHGRYWIALCRSWQTPTPGVATEDQWRRWMGYSEADWSTHRSTIAAAFRIRADGIWIQKRAAETRKAQKRLRDRARKGATATNQVRWGS